MSGRLRDSKNDREYINESYNAYCLEWIDSHPLYKLIEVESHLFEVENSNQNYDSKDRQAKNLRQIFQNRVVGFLLAWRWS